MNKLGEMMHDLPKANAARAKLAEFDGLVETAAGQVKGANSAVLEGERAISNVETALNMKKNLLPPDYHYAANALEEAKGRVTDLAKRGVEDTAILARAEDQLNSAQAKMSSINRSAKDVLDEIGTLEKNLAADRAALGGRKDQLDVLAKQHTDLVNKRQKKYNQLMTGLNDITRADVEAQSNVAGIAQRELDAATAEGRAELGKELESARAARNKAEVDAASAQGLLDDLRAQAERERLKFAKQPTEGGLLSTIGRALYWASSPIRYSLTIAGELVFGVGQSPQEITEILLQGRFNVQLLRSHLGAIRRAAYDQQRRIQMVKHQLDACLKGSKVAPPSPPSPPSPPTTAKPMGKAA